MKINKINQRTLNAMWKKSLQYANEFRILDGVSRCFRETKHPSLIKQAYHLKEVSNDDYVFIPLDSERAFSVIYLAYKIMIKNKVDPGCFYDIGSGYGNILFLVNNIINKCIVDAGGYRMLTIGIEKYKRENVPLLQEPAKYKDIMEIGPNDLNAHSIIYLFNPLCNATKMQEAINHLVSIMPHQSIIAFVSAGSARLSSAPLKNSEEFILYGSGEYLYRK